VGKIWPRARGSRKRNRHNYSIDTRQRLAFETSGYGYRHRVRPGAFSLRQHVHRVRDGGHDRTARSCSGLIALGIWVSRTIQQRQLKRHLLVRDKPAGSAGVRHAGPRCGLRFSSKAGRQSEQRRVIGNRSLPAKAARDAGISAFTSISVEQRTEPAGRQMWRKRRLARSRLYRAPHRSHQDTNIPRSPP